MVQPQAATVWLAPVAPPTFTVTAATGTGFYAYIAPGTTGFNAIHAGLLVEAGAGVPADTYVVSYENGRVEFSQELSETITNEVLTFSSQSPNNGIGLSLLHTTSPTLFECPSTFENGVTLYAASATGVAILWDFE